MSSENASFDASVQSGSLRRLVRISPSSLHRPHALYSASEQHHMPSPSGGISVWHVWEVAPGCQTFLILARRSPREIDELRVRNRRDRRDQCAYRTGGFLPRSFHVPRVASLARARHRRRLPCGSAGRRTRHVVRDRRARSRVDGAQCQVTRRTHGTHGRARRGGVRWRALDDPGTARARERRYVSPRHRDAAQLRSLAAGARTQRTRRPQRPDVRHRRQGIRTRRPAESGGGVRRGTGVAKATSPAPRGAAPRRSTLR